jgi:hypothetical protein
MVGEGQLTVEDAIDTLTLVLVERYGSEAIAVAERQASTMGGLPRETWLSIIDRLRASA